MKTHAAKCKFGEPPTTSVFSHLTKKIKIWSETKRTTVPFGGSGREGNEVTSKSPRVARIKGVRDS